MEENVYSRESTEKEKQVETESVKCSSCGANMVFNPDEKTLYCTHCGNKLEFKVDSAKELDLHSALESKRNFSKDSAEVFRCGNCGAKVVLNKGLVATCCPFCGTNYAKKSSELAGLKPNALLPFSFGEDSAIAKAKEWAKKRFYAPRKFKKNINADNLKGVYMPCFTFDSRTISYYDGKIGKIHTRIVGSGNNRRTETYVVWKHISGTYFENFDDVLITAGSRFDQSKLNKLSPFPTNSSKAYDEKYTLGFMMYHYDNEIVDCWNNAKDTMNAHIRSGILSQYSYDKVAYLNVNTRHEQTTYKYAMLPVYVGNFNYTKKIYNFYVNGVSGKVSGKTPKSILKIIGTVLIGLAVIVGLYFLLR